MTKSCVLFLWHSTHYLWEQWLEKAPKLKQQISQLKIIVSTTVGQIYEVHNYIISHGHHSSIESCTVCHGDEQYTVQCMDTVCQQQSMWVECEQRKICSPLIPISITPAHHSAPAPAYFATTAHRFAHSISGPLRSDFRSTWWLCREHGTWGQCSGSHCKPSRLWA